MKGGWGEFLGCGIRVERSGVRRKRVIQASGSGFRSKRAHVRVPAPGLCLIQVCAFKHSCVVHDVFTVCRDFFYTSESTHLCVSRPTRACRRGLARHT